VIRIYDREFGLVFADPPHELRGPIQWLREEFGRNEPEEDDLSELWQDEGGES
jgi:hypothetical protein